MKLWPETRSARPSQPGLAGPYLPGPNNPMVSKLPSTGSPTKIHKNYSTSAYNPNSTKNQRLETIQMTSKAVNAAGNNKILSHKSSQPDVIFELDSKNRIELMQEQLNGLENRFQNIEKTNFRLERLMMSINSKIGAPMGFDQPMSVEKDSDSGWGFLETLGTLVV